VLNIHKCVLTDVGPIVFPDHEDYERYADGWATEVIQEDGYRIRSIAEELNAECIVDIGASIGVFSRLCESVFPGCITYAFEAVDPHYRFASANMAGRQGHLQHCGIIGHFYSNWRDYIFQEGYEKFIDEADFPIKSPAEVWPPQKVDILKIDCEGAEAGILSELRSLNRLEEIEYICGEWHDARTGKMCQQILKGDFDVEISGLRS